MLLLLTIGLVLVGAVALVIGFIGGEQLPIFISIVCSLLAGAVLVIFSRVSRRQPAVGGATAAPGAEEEVVEERVPEEEVEEAVSAEPTPTAERAPARRREPAWEPDLADDEEFPIEDYDELLVSEILPLLTELDPDELEMVRRREDAGKSRATLLRRIEQLQEEGAPAEPAASRAGPTTERLSTAAFRDEADLDEEEEEEAVAVEEEEELVFPIEDYDDLRVSEILPLLPELYDDELEMVREREEADSNRTTVLNRIDELLGEEAPPPPPKRAPAKKTAAKKAPAKKTAAKKAPAKKAPAKRTAAKKTAAKRATPKKAAAKKSSAKKTAKRGTKKR